MSFVEADMQRRITEAGLRRQRYSGISGFVEKAPETETGTQSTGSEPANDTKPAVINGRRNKQSVRESIALRNRCGWREFAQVDLKQGI